MGAGAISETSGDLYRNANCGDQLCYLQCVFPGDSAAEGFVGYDDQIPRMQRDIYCPAAEHSAFAAYYGPVSPDHKNRPFVSHRRGPARLLQIPACTLSGLESNRRWVVNGPIDHCKIWLLWNVNHIS